MGQSSILKLAYRGLDFFQGKIARNEPFAFPRYGDGEFASILGFPGKNCDGVRYTTDLQNALSETLRYPHLDDSYYYGLLAIAVRFFKPYIERFVVVNSLDILWTEATFLVAANRHGKLGNFLNVLQTRPILYVGPKPLRGLPEALGLQIAHFIEIPPVTAFEAREEIVNKVLVYADTADFVGFSAGPATKWLIWSLFPDLGETHTLFDFGSIFDGYVGRPSRKYQRRDTWSGFAQANTS